MDPRRASLPDDATRRLALPDAFAVLPGERVTHVDGKPVGREDRRRSTTARLRHVL